MCIQNNNDNLMFNPTLRSDTYVESIKISPYTKSMKGNFSH